MSFDSTGVTSQARPLLAAELEDRLVGVLARALGLAVLLAVAAAALSLVSWSVADPSLTHATSGRTRNLAGPFGAIVSDLVMQMLGLAGIVALLPPAYWGAQLVIQERIGALKPKLLLAPAAVIFLASAFSSLPAVASWPLKYGFGGFLGDLGLGLMTSLLAHVNAERAAAAAGLFYFAGGMMLLTASLGLSQNDLATLLTRRQRAAAGNGAVPPAGRRSWRLDWRGWRSKPQPQADTLNIDPFADAADGAGRGTTHDPDRSADRHAAVHGGYRDDDDSPVRPIEPWRGGERGMTATHGAGVGRAARHQERPWRSLESPADAGHDDAEVRREPSFDAVTEAASRHMASRFAPVLMNQGDEPADEPSAPSSGSRFGAGLFAGWRGGLRRSEPAYRRPSLNLLKRGVRGRGGPEQNQVTLRGIARLLTDVLADFGIKGEIREIRPGPVVTLYELEPARGTKAQRVIGLADDIARSMSATAVRVAVVPGRSVIGIELPNVKRETVALRDLLESEAFRSGDTRLPVALGTSIGGEPIVADLARMPHLLVAGTTGSGKSVGINAMIMSLLYRLSPQECRFLMIDPKMLELSIYNGIPHLLTPVVTDPQKAVAALSWAVAEMEERYKRMAKLNVRNIDVFNNRVRNARKQGEGLARTVQTGFDSETGQAIYEKEDLDLDPMPYIVVVVDEFADLMAVAGKDIEHAVQRLAQMARAAGIHLIMATQRPSVDIITGTIKANFPTRISFRVASKIDSRTILNETGAEQLLGQGDMLYSGGSGQLVRVHGPFVSDEEVEAIAQSLREQGEPRYVGGITEAVEAAPAPDSAGRVSEDDLYDRAVAIVVRDQKASTSYIQRRLQIGYNRAADMIERMQRDGIVGPANHAGKRLILMGGPGPDGGAA